LTKLLILLLVVSLTENIFPIVNVIAILGLLALYVAHTNPPLPASAQPGTARRFLVAAYVFWTASYLLTGAPVANFVSYDFLRFDGGILIAYLPLLAFIDYSLDERFIRRAVGLFLTLLSLVAVLGAVEYADAVGIPLGMSILPDDLQLVHFAPASPQYVLHGLFRAHNSAGAVFAIAACISLALLLYEKKDSVLSLRTVWFACTLAGLMLSKSRTSYIAFCATSLFLLFSARKEKKRALKITALIILPLIFSLVTETDVSGRLEAVTSTEDDNVLGRFVHFQVALEDIVRSPVVGIGFGRFNDDSLTFSGIPNLIYIATGGEVINDDSHAHNSYLHFLAEGGVVGLSLMMGIWISTYRWLKRIREQFPEFTFGHAFARGVQACVLLEFCLSFTEHSMGTAVTSLTIFTMVGLVQNLAACTQEGPMPLVTSLQPNVLPGTIG
jgi:O-antigen ligase